MLRRAVEHEDVLINHRLTWLLTAHGFLFAGFAAVQAALIGKSPVALGVVVGLEVLLIVIFCCAIMICRIVWYSVAIANEHHGHLREWWKKRYPNEARREIQFPPRGHVDDAFGLLLRPKFQYVEIPDHDRSEAFQHEPRETFPTGQPPVSGSFDFDRNFSIESIPIIFMIIDVMLIFVCVFAVFWL